MDKIEKELRSFKEESQFVKFDLSLFNQLNSCIKILSQLVPERGKWNRNEAIPGALLVRIYKFNVIFIEQAKKERLEICYLLSRIIFETAINLRFLIKNTPEMLLPFIAASFKSELTLREEINRKMDTTDCKLPIEERMLNSIDKDLKNSDLNDDEVVIHELSKKWHYKSKGNKRNFNDKLDDIGIPDPTYISNFALPSHAVHGDWIDALYFNLDIYKNNQHEYGPNLDWKKIRPHLLESLLIHLSDACFDYIKFLSLNENAGFAKKITRIKTYAKLSGEIHESNLSKNKDIK